MTNTEFDKHCEKLIVHAHKVGSKEILVFVQHARQLRQQTIEFIDHNDDWDKDWAIVGWNSDDPPELGSDDDPLEFEA